VRSQRRYFHHWPKDGQARPAALLDRLGGNAVGPIQGRDTLSPLAGQGQDAPHPEFGQATDQISESIAFGHRHHHGHLGGRIISQNLNVGNGHRKLMTLHPRHHPQASTTCSIGHTQSITYGKTQHRSPMVGFIAINDYFANQQWGRHQQRTHG